MRFHQILTLAIVTQSFLVGLYSLKHLNKALKAIFGLVCLAVITEFSSQIIIYIFKGTTIWISHFYVMIEFFLWALFYWFLMKSIIKRNLFWALIILSEIYFILNTIFIQNMNEYPITRAVESIFIVVLSIITFYRIMIEGNLDKLIKEPVVWINTAALIYFSSSVFFHLLFNLFLNNNIDFLKLSGYLFIAVNTCLYLVFSVGFYLQKLKSMKNKT